MITPATAGKAFALSLKQVQKLPVLYSIPGRYGIARKEVRQHQLVSVSAARDLALSTHGSAENVAKLTARMRYKLSTAGEIRYLQRAFTTAIGRDPLMVPDQGNRGVDPFFGLASTPSPSIPGTPGTPEDGLWCKGCERTFEAFTNCRMATDVIIARVPSDCSPQRVFFGLTRRAHSRIGLLEYSQRCYGAQYFLQQQEEER